MVIPMKQRVIVIDGMGGGIGAQLISRIRELNDEEPEIIALGTNAVATERMIKAGAHRGAAGENAIKVSVPLGDFILGPIGIVISNSLMGEISPVMTEAILTAPGEKILLPLQQDHFRLVGMESLPFTKIIDKAVELLKERLRHGRQDPGPGIHG
jgi:hypothetical protein